MSLLTEEVLRTIGEISRLTASLSVDDPSTAATFTWQNTEYAAVAAVEVQGNLFGPGGLTPDNNLTITVRRDILPTPGPQPDQFLRYNENPYRIDVVKPSPDGASLILICNDPNRGAGIIEREI